MSSKFQCPVAVHLFLIKSNKVLLLRRYNTGFCDGMFSVPAGHINGGENVVRAMIREVKEEIKVDINKKDLHIVQVMHRKEPEEERIDFFFESKKWRGKIEIGEPDKCSELKWVKLNSLPKGMVPYVRYALKQYLKKKPLTLFGWRN